MKISIEKQVLKVQIGIQKHLQVHPLMLTIFGLYVNKNEYWFIYLRDQSSAMQFSLSLL